MRLEPCLNLDLPKLLYSSIARFRLSSHNLAIELGRHKRPYLPPGNRICDKCILNKVEDELHCLMECPKWNLIRINLLKVASEKIDGFLVLSSLQQFNSIMSNKSLEVNIALGRFLQLALYCS